LDLKDPRGRVDPRTLLCESEDPFQSTQKDLDPQNYRENYAEKNSPAETPNEEGVEPAFREAKLHS